MCDIRDARRVRARCGRFRTRHARGRRVPVHPRGCLRRALRAGLLPGLPRPAPYMTNLGFASDV